ncbi:GAF domain-containing sensor histidine kinase [Haliovirga abyssi]|uniref:histidine kinase n=1 Tax=Haliovirga abyssi TaxID=2996794 RepID=A0AAU9DIR9_9FUSO|nr:ATP-binding protein [Haliovirga abyssi]BDU49692.1 two-component sensor histidine kinase [Haliovirga abyssi]
MIEIHELENEIKKIKEKNIKLMENQVKLGDITNNYMMLYYLNKTIHESKTSKMLWKNYLTNITSGGFNYENAFIILPDDENNFNIKLFLNEFGELKKETFSLTEAGGFVNTAVYSKASTNSVSNTSTAIPILNNNNKITAILVADKSCGISFEDIQLLEIYAQQTVSTIENILLNEKLIEHQKMLGEKVDQFIMLHYVTKEIHDSTRYFEVLTKYLVALSSPMGFNFTNACIYIIESPIKKVTFENEKLVFKNLQTLDDILVENSKKENYWKLSKNETSLALPLFSNRKLNAIIKIESDKKFTQEDIQLLEIFAMQTASVLENTKLNFNLEKEVKKRTLDLQKAYDELKKLDFAKDEFLAIVSHELRTPLTSIMAYLETLSYGGVDPETTEEFINIIYSESKRLKIIVDDILDLSKLEAGKMTFDLTPTNLNELLNKSIKEFSEKAKEKSIDVEFIAEELPFIDLDYNRMLQVISNIISNSIKFTPNFGTIKVSTYSKDSKIGFKIKDSGIGINKNNKNKIFSKFEQIENTDNHSKGTGLGMPISKMLVEQLNGNIWFESEVNKGTTFYVEFPINSD